MIFLKLDKLKQLRLEKNLTLKNVADKVGITLEYYWMLENGKRNMSYEMACKIAAVFERTPDEIFLNRSLTCS